MTEVTSGFDYGRAYQPQTQAKNLINNAAGVNRLSGRAPSNGPDKFCHRVVTEFHTLESYHTLCIRRFELQNQ